MKIALSAPRMDVLRKFYGRYGDLIKQNEVSLSQLLNDIL